MIYGKNSDILFYRVNHFQRKFGLIHKCEKSFSLLISRRIFHLHSEERERAMKRIHTNNYIRVLSVLTAVLLLLTCLAPTILAAGTESLKLWAWDRKDTLSFDFQNMLPGDSEYKTYEITVSYKKATNLIYSIKIDEGGEKLAEVLRVEVSVDDKIVYDGLMKDMTPVIHNLSGNAPWKVLFKVRVYLDTSVGNEYMGKTLSADFKWEISSGGSSGSDETTSSKKPSTISAQSRAVPWECLSIFPTSSLHTSRLSKIRSEDTPCRSRKLQNRSVSSLSCVKFSTSKFIRIVRPPFVFLKWNP